MRLVDGGRAKPAKSAAVASRGAGGQSAAAAAASPRHRPTTVRSLVFAAKRWNIST